MLVEKFLISFRNLTQFTHESNRNTIKNLIRFMNSPARRQRWNDYESFRNAMWKVRRLRDMWEFFYQRWFMWIAFSSCRRWWRTATQKEVELVKQLIYTTRSCSLLTQHLSSVTAFDKIRFSQTIWLKVVHKLTSIKLTNIVRDFL